MIEKTYVGSVAGGYGVSCEGITLPTRYDIVQHFAGFDWGRPTAGAMQLAFAILYEHFGRRDLAKQYYLPFYNKVTSRLPARDDWTIESSYIRDVLAEVDEEALGPTDGDDLRW
jgi:hypothetical protein